MEFFETVKKRRSIRTYLPKQVENEKLEKILAAANQAPSAGDTQGYEMIVVEDAYLLDQLWKTVPDQTFVKPAPLAVVFCANEKRSSEKHLARGKNLYCIQDATIAAAYAQLAAADMGLGTVWVGSFNEEEVRKIIEAPEYLRPVAVIPLGYIGGDPPPTSRRALSDIVHRDKF